MSIHEESMSVSAAVGNLIASDFPKVDYTDEDVKKAFSEYSEDELAKMKELGIISDDFELFYVIREFCSSLGLDDVADDEYILEIFKNAKKLDADEFESDPYMKLFVDDVKSGDIFLTHSEYERGEIFQYDMPDLNARVVALKLGFFTRKVRFPALYQGVMPWVSVCPSEINSMSEQIKKAHGKVLVLGLGLGYYPYMISSKDCVSEIVIVEIEPKIIDVFEKNLLPQFPNKDKISVVCADAIEYMKGVKAGDFDFIFADIWEGAVDGAPLYDRIKAHEKRLAKTEFTYWIEDQIRCYEAEK